MRITNSMMVSQFLYDVNGSLNRLSKYQNQVNSTKRITRISDDPLATVASLKARNRLSNLAYYQSNISTAGSYLTEAESSVSALDEIIKSVYEQVVSAISGAKGQDERNIIAEELENLKNELIGVGNSTIGTSYIFGGYNFTGSTDGKNIVPPFTIDQNTGHLIYNGINLSQFAWREEYNDNISLMGKFGKMIIDMDSDESELYKYPTDYYAKETICANARKALSELIDCGKNALYAAKQFGVDPDAQEYKDLESFVNNLSEYAQQLEREYSKELLGDKRIVENDPNIEKDAEGNIDYDYYNERGITVITVDERANYFSVDTLKEIISGIEGTEEIEDKKGIADLIEEQFVFSDGDEEVTIKPESALANLALEIDIADDVQDAYDAEKSKRAELQIGASQTVGFTLNGLELMGVGKNNVYHVFDKCIRMLRGEMSFDGLKGMITTLQNKQSDTLNLQTKIGSTQNRLELISNRYDSSELNYTQIRSEAEDADMAEALMNFTTAKTVYSAALASGAKMLQISLIDFLR